MAGSKKSSYKILSNVIRIIIFIAALYIAYRILKPLLLFLLGVSFWLIKVLVFIAVALLVIHLFLKLIFGIDLWRKLNSRSRWR